MLTGQSDLKLSGGPRSCLSVTSFLDHLVSQTHLSSSQRNQKPSWNLLLFEVEDKYSESFQAILYYRTPKLTRNKFDQNLITVKKKIKGKKKWCSGQTIKKMQVLLPFGPELLSPDKRSVFSLASYCLYNENDKLFHNPTVGWFCSSGYCVSLIN